jgi:hypothetical protein
VEFHWVFVYLAVESAVELHASRGGVTAGTWVVFGGMWEGCHNQFSTLNVIPLIHSSHVVPTCVTVAHNL